MSYSISARGASLAVALCALAVAFDEQVLKNQEIHSRDRDMALAQAKAVGDQLGAQPEGQEVTIQLSGSLGWTGAPDVNVTSANCSATVWYTLPSGGSA
jgi:hypothetical protein